MTRLLADSTVHTLNPWVVRFTDEFGIRWYGLAYLTGFVVAWLLLTWMARTRRCLLTPIQVTDFLTWGIAGVVIGGRLGHAIFYDQSLLWTVSSSPPFWALLAIHKGGMSSHGGIIGVVIASILFGRRIQVPFLHLTDLSALVAAPGLGLGRIANWVNGELWGRPLPSSWWGSPPWWSVKFPEEALTFPPGSQAAAAVDAAARQLGMQPLPGHSLARQMVAACYAGQQDAIQLLSPILAPRWPSQLMQAATDGVILLAALLGVWWKPRRPGVVTGCFFAFYGALRLMTEQIRMPDPDPTTIAGFTLPMQLSALMIVGGAAVATWAARRPAPRIGGIGAPQRPAGGVAS